jgi:hypothetical protein
MGGRVLQIEHWGTLCKSLSEGFKKRINTFQIGVFTFAGGYHVYIGCIYQMIPSSCLISPEEGFRR